MRSQRVFAFAPYCKLLNVHTQGVNFSQYLKLIFVLVYFFLDYSYQISRFLDFLGSHITKTFFDGRSIERTTQKVDFSTHECMRSGYNIWQRYTLYKTSRKERGNKLIANWAQKDNASKFVLNHKQERKWALELVH